MKDIVKQVVGIDIGKDSFYVCYKTKDIKDRVKILGTRSFKNTDKGIVEFIEWAEKKNKNKNVDIIFVMEATGVYYENLCYFLDAKNYKVIVALPTIIKFFIKTNKVKTKTDKNDAKVIADYGLEKIFSEKQFWVKPSDDFRVIRTLTREHSSLKRRLTALKNKTHALKHAKVGSKEVLEIIKDEIEFINKQIEKIKQHIKQLIKESTELARKIKNIEKIKGLGFMSIVTILAETNCFTLFKSMKQLTSYAGLDVVENQSGKFNGKTKLSKKGNANLRTALYMPALSASKYNKTLKKVYQRIVEGKKYKKQATVAVMRKLLTLTYTIWKKDEEYIENYVPAK